jgi:hypothetical protein
VAGDSHALFPRSRNSSDNPQPARIRQVKTRLAREFYVTRIEHSITTATSWEPTKAKKDFKAYYENFYK